VASVLDVRGILTNKMYVGIKSYHIKGESRETKGVWPAIVDEAIFKRANELLKKNHHRVRYSQANRYPFLLSGLVSCGACGDTMCGKSANGNGGKCLRAFGPPSRT
jgi:site-specific DNA recombinase